MIKIEEVGNPTYSITGLSKAQLKAIAHVVRWMAKFPGQARSGLLQERTGAWSTETVDQCATMAEALEEAYK